jgi:Leucine rich repeat variant
MKIVPASLLSKIARFELLSLAGVVEELKTKHPKFVSQIDFFIQRDPTKKYLAYEVKTLASGQALENEIADVIELFHQFKDKLEQKDINQWQFTKLRDKLFETRDFLALSKSQQKKELKENIKKIEIQGAQKLYEDDQCELIYVPDKASACFYGKGTKWCITMQNANYFEDYQSNNVVFYYLLRKDLPPENINQKVAFAVQRDQDNQIVNSNSAIQVFLSDDRQIDAKSAFPGLATGSTILNIIKQDVPTHPMGFLAKLNFKPNELSLEDYAKNMTEENKHTVAHKATDSKVLSFLSKDKDGVIRYFVAKNKNAPPEILASLSQDPDTSVREAVAANLNTPPDVLLSMVNDDGWLVINKLINNLNTPIQALLQIAKETKIEGAGVDARAALARRPNTPPEILSQLAGDGAAYVRREVAGNLNTPVEALEYLAQKINEHPVDFMGDISIRGKLINNPNFPPQLRDHYFPLDKFHQNGERRR